MHTKFFQYLLVLAVVLSSVLLSQSWAALPHSTAKEVLVLPNINPVLSYQFPAINLPLESSPTSNDRDIPNENEQEDDFDGIGLTDQQTLFSLFHISTVTNWFIQPASFIQNRVTVPLFVLYHSWKDFVL